MTVFKDTLEDRGYSGSGVYVGREIPNDNANLLSLGDISGIIYNNTFYIPSNLNMLSVNDDFRSNTLSSLVNPLYIDGIRKSLFGSYQNLTSVQALLSTGNNITLDNGSVVENPYLVPIIALKGLDSSVFSPIVTANNYTSFVVYYGINLVYDPPLTEGQVGAPQVPQVITTLKMQWEFTLSFNNNLLNMQNLYFSIKSNNAHGMDLCFTNGLLVAANESKQYTTISALGQTNYASYTNIENWDIPIGLYLQHPTPQISFTATLNAADKSSEFASLRTAISSILTNDYLDRIKWILSFILFSGK